MRLPIAAMLDDNVTLDFCQTVVPGSSPISVPLRAKPGSPLIECFAIVPEHIATHGGEQLNGWAIWHAEGLYIEAEFHAIWRSPTGEVIDLTPRPVPMDSITFLADPSREYRGRQVDNIRQPLTNDRDVIRFLHLAGLKFKMLNHGELAQQQAIDTATLPPRMLREWIKLEKEMKQLELRLHRRHARRADASRFEMKSLHKSILGKK